MPGVDLEGEARIGDGVEPLRVGQDAIVLAVTEFECAVTEITNTYRTRTEGLPMTDPLPDYNTVELKLA